MRAQEEVGTADATRKTQVEATMEVVLEPRTALQLEASARAFTLAATLVAYPDVYLAELMGPLAPTLSEHPGAGPLLVWWKTQGGDASALAALQGRYIDLFDRGKGRVSLYETEHGRMRGLGKGNDLADISGFYLAFGLTLDEAGHEALDHLAVELEFYAILLLKQHVLDGAANTEGGEVVLAARRKFLTDHLGRFVAAIAGQEPVRADAVYGPLLGWCAELVAAECEALAVTPAPLDFFAGEREPEQVECGAVHLPVVES